MDEERSKKQKGDLVVALTAMTSVSGILMQHWVRNHGTEAELDRLINQLTKTLKNAPIEGIDYDQQALLVERSIISGKKFFEKYRNRLITARDAEGK